MKRLNKNYLLAFIDSHIINYPVPFNLNYFWSFSIFTLPINYNLLDIEFISIFYKLLPFLLTILGFLTVYFLYFYTPSFFYSMKKNKIFKFAYTFFNKKWYFNRLYAQFITQKLLNQSYSFSYQILDRGLIEQLGPYGFINLITNISKTLMSGQTSSVTSSIIFLNLAILSILLLSFSFIALKLQFVFILLTTFLIRMQLFLNKSSKKSYMK